MKAKKRILIIICLLVSLASILVLVFLVMPGKIKEDIASKKTTAATPPPPSPPKISTATTLDAPNAIKLDTDTEITLNTPFNSQMEISKTHFPDHVCNLSSYGGVGDGKTVNTKAFAAAIDDCAKDGGGQVVVPSGVWFTGPIKLQSNIDLEVQKGATILFSPNPSDYLPVVFSRFEGIEYYNYSPPIYANGCQNVAITGQGTLNGQGDINWWQFSGADISKLYSMGARNIPVTKRVFGTVAAGLRPDFIEFVNCQKVLVDGVTLIKGPMWTIHSLYSQNVIVTNVNIQTAPGPSTDGVVIDSSQNVLVDGVTLNTGDDSIVLKSGRDADGRRVGIPTENVVIQNCHVVYGHGAVAIGSEMSGGIKNILAQNITVDNAKWGFRTKANSDRGGTVENITIKNFNISNLQHEAIVFDMMYEKEIMSGLAKFKPLFQNINLSDFTCRNIESAIDIIGIPNSSASLQDLNLKNISVAKAKNGLSMNYVQNVTLDGINLNSNPKNGPAFSLSNAQNVTLSNSSCPSQMPSCLSLLGSTSKNINLSGNNFDQQSDKITIGKEVNRNAINIQGLSNEQNLPQSENSVIPNPSPDDSSGD